jgi:ubiquinone/menaquinone biosynthesis C-methylase UbiE
METESKVTAAVRRRYNRIALVYDLMEGLVERSRYSKWRELLWSKVGGVNILEVGVGTGRNFLVDSLFCYNSRTCLWPDGMAYL